MLIGASEIAFGKDISSQHTKSILYDHDMFLFKVLYAKHLFACACVSYFRDGDWVLGWYPYMDMMYFQFIDFKRNCSHIRYIWE